MGRLKVDGTPKSWLGRLKVDGTPKLQFTPELSELDGNSIHEALIILEFSLLYSEWTPSD